ncbi:uncharacterized protein PgNI_07480 [Pyricularia grisea]|uniref:Actin cytoskeleton-regulatory complex protein SLA1 n=1 Tax=Pyricularia grisea TaxID=148305 RepID=A0A6P8B077_PYRGI|nr:uncharacterized protein PgNI_07480 [Pyricularia grisea]TLD08320.1 hypothetical protein PgNI_07480 [Pyricularia grisea]
MGFIGVYQALYDYEPQSEGELVLAEGDLLYILEKSAEDAWWKAKKKAGEDEEEEPEGLIPNTYVEEVQPKAHARALFDYTRQSDEELTFPEDAQLAVYDDSDPDWILARYEDDYGFVPSNYIEVQDGAAEEAAAPVPQPPALPARSQVDESPEPSPGETSPSSSAVTGAGAATGAAATLAGVLTAKAASSSAAATRSAPPPLALPPRPTYTSEGSDTEDAKSPPLPTRPREPGHRSMDQAVVSPQSPPLPQRSVNFAERDDVIDNYKTPTSPGLSPGGFRMYNINEMVSVLGKKKKMPTTLGINLKTGTILIAPERAQDGPSREWTADKMSHYSREGKHVFLDLVRPSKSLDLHAGAKDTAEEIVSVLGELAGAIRAEGLREVIMAGTGQQQKKGQVLYDFMAQGDDEVTVAVGDDVIILDDTKSEDWWQVRRVKNGKEGVVPSSYIEVIGTVPIQPTSAASGVNAGKSTVAQNRLEEERLTKEAVRAAMKDERRQSEVGPGMRLPERNSSLSGRSRTDSNNGGQQRSRENGNSSSSKPKSKPDSSKVRTWTDRSKSFSVEAQYLGLRDGKINLHKMNGVKIAVPIAKMSVEDLEYVERVEGISLDEDKPLSVVKKTAMSNRVPSGARLGASIEPPKPEYDWFPFFLGCDIAPGLCERYAQAFTRDSMDESVLPDVDATILRNMGIKEGDIIKIMRFLDNKYARKKKGEEESGGLFSGPGGTLKNNTTRGRPKPNSQTSDVVDPKAFTSQATGSSATDAKSPAPPVVTPASATGTTASGFDDDAWNVKPSNKQTSAETAAQAPSRSAEAPSSATPAPAAAPVPATTPAPKPIVSAPTGAMQELSLLTQPLQPDKTATPILETPAQQPHIQQQPQQQQGATPSFFSTLTQQPTGAPSVNGQQPGSMPRLRPVAPQYTQGQGALVPPPPSRPLSAPQSAQPSAFTPPPLQPQMTGHVAPPGQSLNEINQARLQQQYAQQMQQMQPQQQMGVIQGFQPQPTGQPGMMMPFQTGMQPQQGFGAGPQNQFMQPQPTGMMGMGMNMSGPQQMQSPFADPNRQSTFSPVQMQPTGFQGGYNPMQQQQQFGMPQQTGGGINSFLPPAMEPQRTGMPQIPQIQQPQQLQPQQTGTHFTHGFGNAGMAPLQPQKTGPPPPVRFGIQDAPKLAPQPTGRRANLSAATPQNPFGF